MNRNRSVPNATVIPVLVYADVREAANWLSAAFGFVERVQIGEGHRAQLSYGDGALVLGDTYGDRRPPRAGDEETHSLIVRVEDADAHCERARRAGAKITMEPKDMSFGERQYNAEDLAGHHWTFSQSIDDVEPEQWGGTTVNGGWPSA